MCVCVRVCVCVCVCVVCVCAFVYLIFSVRVCGVGGGGWRKGFIDRDVACLSTVDAADYECIIALFKISTNVHHLYYFSNSA